MIHVLAITLIGGLFNWLVRGGGVKQWFPKVRMTKAANVLAFGGMCWYVTGNPYYGASMVLSMALGQSFKIFEPMSDVAVANRDAFLWHLVVFERGIAWAAPLLLVSMYFNGVSGLWFMTGFLMPLCYAIEYYRPSKYSWKTAEFLYGLCLWFPITQQA